MLQIAAFNNWGKINIMEKLIRNFIILYAVVFAVTGWVGAWALREYYQVTALGTYALFPAFFMIYGFAHMMVVQKTFHLDARKLVNIYMLLKLIKNMLSGAFVLFLFFFVELHRSQLLVAFGVFYLFQLTLESVFLLNIEKLKKKN